MVKVISMRDVNLASLGIENEEVCGVWFDYYQENSNKAKVDAREVQQVVVPSKKTKPIDYGRELC